MDCLYIVMPAYNEAATLRAVVRDWHRMLHVSGASPESRLLLIDDGSTDDSAALLEELSADYPQLVVQHQANQGHGAAILNGYRLALEQGADYVFQTDSDGQTDPEKFPDFWNLRQEATMIIGERRKRQDGRSRTFVSLVLCLVIWLTLGVKLKDPNTPFRLMHGPSLLHWLQSVPEHFFLANALLAATAVWTGSKILWLPISFKPRQGGSNSLNLKRIIGVGWQSIGAFKEARRLLEKYQGPRID